MEAELLVLLSITWTLIADEFFPWLASDRTFFVLWILWGVFSSVYGCAWVCLETPIFRSDWSLKSLLRTCSWIGLF
jgi:hypothetical protein